MRVLLTCDDGFHAAGIRVLKDIVSGAWSSAEVWIAAPLRDCSASGGAVSVRNPVKVRVASEQEIEVDGTPVDSVLMGLYRMKNLGVTPDLVLSGINHGTNVGRYMWSSGTIAAASAASSFGIPAIAISQEYPSGDSSEDMVVVWQNSRESVAGLVEQLLDSPQWDRKRALSINIPCSTVQGVRFGAQGKCPIKDVPVAELSEFATEKEDSYVVSKMYKSTKLSDNETATDDEQLLQDGFIVVTPITRDLTCYDTLDQLLGPK
ncbi:MAG: 5'/3'-nucleotidase SurE [Anaplasma sp.]